MKAIILAAGRGSRMGALTQDRPKCFAPLGGKPLLDHQCRALTAGGVTEIGLVRGYRGDAFDGMPLHFFENPRWEQTNMVASLMCAAPWLRQSDCIVSYSDIFYSSHTIRSLVQDRHSDIVLTFDPDWLDLWSRRFSDPCSDAETFRLASDGRVREIGKKTSDPKEIEGQYMGLLKFTPDCWGRTEDYLSTLTEAERAKLDMTSLLSRLIAADMPVHAIAKTGSWGEADTAQDIILYEGMLAQNEIVLE